MGRLAAHFDAQRLLEFCSEWVPGWVFAAEIQFRSDISMISLRSRWRRIFAHCGGGIRVAQHDATDWKLGTASYVTISDSENSVTFETRV
jgi:hypothetical protein